MQTDKKECKLVLKKSLNIVAGAYAKIVLAGIEGRGCRLSAEECSAISVDDAVATVVANHAFMLTFGEDDSE